MNKHLLISSNVNTELGLSVKALTFGHIVDLVQSTLEYYKSDLFHDALWINQYLTEGEPFYYTFDKSGTYIGTDAFVLNTREFKFEMVVTQEDSRWYLTITNRTPAVV